MRKKTVKSSNYRPPSRSEIILALVGLFVVISLLISAIAPSFGTQSSSSPPTTVPITIITQIVSTPTNAPAPTVVSGTPVTSTPGQAPAPGATP